YRRVEEALAKLLVDGLSALSSASICLLCVAAALVPALSSREGGVFGRGDSLAPGGYEHQTTSLGAGGPNARAGIARSASISNARRDAVTGAAPSGRMRTPGLGGSSLRVGDDGVDLGDGENELGPEGYRFSNQGRVRVFGQRIRVNLNSEYRLQHEERDGLPGNHKEPARVPYVGAKVRYNGETREAGAGRKADDHN
ncbi:MAG: hypothetical protein ACRDJI_06830, partial [Actinomycetota bacterium]